MPDKLRERHCRARARYIAVVAEFFESLPTELARLAVPLRGQLTCACRSGGRLEDYLLDDDTFPALDLAFWILDDCSLAEEKKRAELESRIFPGAYLYAAAIALDDNLLGLATYHGPEHLFLSQWLKQEVDRHLRAAAGEKVDEARLAAAWRDGLDEQLRYQRLHIGAVSPFATEDEHRLARRWAPLRLPPLIALAAAGGGDKADEVEQLLDSLICSYMLLRDIQSLQADLALGHYSLPIVRLMQATGMPLDRQPLPEKVIGAAVTTAVLPELVEAGLRRCRGVSEGFRRIALPSLAEYADGLGASHEALKELFVLNRTLAALAPRQEQAAGEAPPARPVAHTRAVEAARRFLLADPELRESWEIYRWGLFGIPELTSRHYPEGVITANLAQAGLEVRELADRVFADYRRADRHYFTEPNPMWPDIDSLAILLRLSGHVSDPAAAAQLLATPLAWMEANFDPDGGIAVWMTKGVTEETGRAYVPSLGGARCGAVEANLLLGLAAYDPERFRGRLTALADHLLRRFLTWGAGVSLCYPPLYLCLLMRETLAALRALDYDVFTGVAAEEAGARLDRALAEQAVRLSLSPLETAWLVLAARPEQRRLEWERRLLRGQLIDGGWNLEPFYNAPVPPNAAGWYGSRAITTSFCYRALRALEKGESLA